MQKFTKAISLENLKLSLPVAMFFWLILFAITVTTNWNKRSSKISNNELTINEIRSEITSLRVWIISEQNNIKDDVEDIKVTLASLDANMKIVLDMFKKKQ